MFPEAVEFFLNSKYYFQLLAEPLYNDWLTINICTEITNLSQQYFCVLLFKNITLWRLDFT